MMNRIIHIRQLHSFLQVLAFVFALFFLAPKAYGAFVPSGIQGLNQKAVNAYNLREVYMKIAGMGNKEIEKLTGKKLSIREKAGLHWLRRQARLKGSAFLQNPGAWNDKCFTMYLKNGDVIEVKLIQIATGEIKYQRCNKPDDPEIIIAKDDVFSIKDSNGDAIYSSKDDSWKKGYEVADGKTEKLALAAGITGIGAVTLGLIFWPVGLAAGIAAGIMGIISLGRFKTNPKLRGEGWAITGIVASGLWVFLVVLVLIAFASGW